MLASGVVRVRPVEAGDAAAWACLRRALWPDDGAQHEREIKEFLEAPRRTPLQVFVAVDSDGSMLGFAELSIRNYAEDCETDRVAYLEGWYVVPGARRTGIGRTLVDAAEEWGRSQGCVEFASDAAIDNEDSAAAHRALNFTETAQIRCFRKDL